MKTATIPFPPEANADALMDAVIDLGGVLLVHPDRIEVVVPAEEEAEARRLLAAIFPEAEDPETGEPLTLTKWLTMSPEEKARLWREQDVVRDPFGRFARSFGGMVRDAANPDGGFTVNPSVRRSPRVGMAVSPYPDRERAIARVDFNEESMLAYARENRDLLDKPNHFVGGWHNPDDGRIYLDISIVVSSHEEARQVSMDHEQQAYYDLGEGVVHEVIAGAASGRQEGKWYPPWDSRRW